MSLIIKAAVTINAIGTEVYIEFLQATGDYQAPAGDDPGNPGGFGPPNPIRSSLAMVLFAEHMKVDGNVPAEVLTYDPTTVQSYTVVMTREVNGMLNYNILAIPIYVPLGTYENGDIVYDNENPSSPFIKQLVGGVWISITAKEVVGNDSIDQLNDYTFAVPDAIKLMEELNALKLQKLSKYVKHICEKDEYEPLRTSFEYVEGLLKTATNAFCAQAYNEAQIFIEEIFRYGIEIDLLEENAE